MRRRPRQEYLVRKVELAAPYLPLHYLQPQLIGSDANRRIARDAGKVVVRHRGRVYHSVGHQKQVFAAALGHIAILRQHNRFVEARQRRFRLGENAVHIMPRNLDARRDDGVVDAPPRGCAAADCALDIDVASEWHHHQSEIAVKLMQLQIGYEFRALVRQRADVQVFLVAAALQQVDGDGAEFVDVVWDVHHHNVASLQQALIVFAHSERIERIVFGVPVAANALKHRRAVMEGVRSYADPRLR